MNLTIYLNTSMLSLQICSSIQVYHYTNICLNDDQSSTISQVMRLCITQQIVVTKSVFCEIWTLSIERVLHVLGIGDQWQTNFTGRAFVYFVYL